MALAAEDEIQCRDFRSCTKGKPVLFLGKNYANERLGMKRVIASSAGAELEVLRALLQEAGIPCVIRPDDFADLMVCDPFNAELWVERDEDFGKAEELYAAWCKPMVESVEIWTCLACGQRLATQFDSCWQCGTHRPTAPASATEPTLPDSCDDAIHRAEEMSALLDAILHQPDRPV